ncbi:transcription factor RFX4-like [Ornithodoros turicata]|uniref:transcription factor RFX4-like n=1 Tax=Ornithodoros turicata TaxID=34597 RepID=UPI0031390FFD
MQPVNAASFGKIIRQQFPQLTTRRLGTRGQSRYHYYGIAIRDTSIYFEMSYSKTTGCGDIEIKRELPKQVTEYTSVPSQVSVSNVPRLRAALPDFPQVRDLVLPESVDSDTISTFLTMYRTHCQRVLDTVLRANFDEVQQYLEHFWRGIPAHLSPVLGCNALVNLMGVCDSVLYRALASALLPSPLQPLPDSVLKVISTFSEELEKWLRSATAGFPDNLRAVKFEMGRRFAQNLRRQMSLSHLSQAWRTVASSGNTAGQMLRDWRQLDLGALCQETIFGSQESPQRGPSVGFIYRLAKEFESYLEDETPIEGYMEWMEALVNKTVAIPCMEKSLPARRLARQFLLTWSAFGSRVIRDMTVHGAATFGSFYLLRLLFDDYVLCLLEGVLTDELVRQFLSNAAADAPLVSFPDLSLPSSPTTSIPAPGTPVQDAYSRSPPAQEVPIGPHRDASEFCEVPTAMMTSVAPWPHSEYCQSVSQQCSAYDTRRSWGNQARPDSRVYDFESDQYSLCPTETAVADHAARDYRPSPEDGYEQPFTETTVMTTSLFGTSPPPGPAVHRAWPQPTPDRTFRTSAAYSQVHL